MGAGAALKLASFRVYVDASYARFYNLDPSYSPNAVVLGAGVGWNF